MVVEFYSESGGTQKGFAFKGINRTFANNIHNRRQCVERNLNDIVLAFNETFME